MPVPQVGRLNASNVQKLSRTLKRDDRLRQEAITEIRRSFPAFLRRSFSLTPHDVQAMRRVPPEVWDLLGRASIVSLQHRGDIRFEFLKGSPAIKYEVKGECDNQGKCTASASVSYTK